MDSIEAKLHQLGLALPHPPAPAGSYVPHRIHGDVLILSGMLNTLEGVVTHAGQVGREQTLETAHAAAQVCALNSLAAIKAALGSLERVKEFLFVSGFVNGVAGFADSPHVINGASDLFVNLYGDAGRHARAAVAVAGLPRNATVEIQVTVRFE
jgi:enamine deaminase RidA (YjgF/YER057c/UK114 family)